jgi:hypothetical protein
VVIRHRYRVTKYDPQFRDSSGSYLRDEWTGPHEIGEDIDGHVLTQDEFDTTVNKYLYAVEAFARESGVSALSVVGLNERATPDQAWAGVREGDLVPLERALTLIGSELRGTALGAPLEVPDEFYVHVGDYLYLWIGSAVDCVRATAEATRIGLFVEPDQISSFHV